ncbi:MAG TPA: hypothetical protein VFF73_38455 [Planctomycetota bacterium]|nr:hypothetical protein [Planctomycetota bacterium]
MKHSGYLTSEFILTLIVVLVAAAAALIQVWRGQLDGMGAISLMSAALAAASYALGRSRVKADNGANGQGANGQGANGQEANGQ